MSDLSDIHARLGRIETVLMSIKGDIGMLKAKVAFFGALSGMIAAAVFKWAT